MNEFEIAINKILEGISETREILKDKSVLQGAYRDVMLLANKENPTFGTMLGVWATNDYSSDEKVEVNNAKITKT